MHMESNRILARFVTVVIFIVAAVLISGSVLAGEAATLKEAQQTASTEGKRVLLELFVDD